MESDDPISCTLYRNTKYKIVHKSWGSYPTFLRTLGPLLRLDLSQLVSNAYLVCLWKTNFFLGTLCHHKRCRWFGLFVRTSLSFGSWLSHSLFSWFIFLSEISSWACIMFLFSMLNGFASVPSIGILWKFVILFHWWIILWHLSFGISFINWISHSLIYLLLGIL